jgi:Fur family zinc uptake transcriptional regulator
MQRRAASSVFPARAHDHRSCVSATLRAAEERAARNRLRFTPLRRLVLEIVSASHRPLGAYEVLAMFVRAAPSRRAAPPTVYRALDFLTANGFVHRIDSLNAYVACFAPGAPHRAYFFLCESCGRAAEIRDPGLATALAATAAAAAFRVARETVEIAGRCGACAEPRNAP